MQTLIVSVFMGLVFAVVFHLTAYRMGGDFKLRTTMRNLGFAIGAAIPIIVYFELWGGK